MPTPRVFVIQNHASYNKSTGLMVPRYDLSPAEKFGELVFLLSPITVPNNPAKVVAELRRKLHDFSDEDHLLLIGSPVFIGWATAVAADINDGKVALLQYSGNRKQYFSVKADGLIDLE